MTAHDWDQDPEVQEWFEHLRTELEPKVAASAFAMSLWPGVEHVDPKMAVELGYMILLDKPILVVVAPGMKVPENLMKVARRVVELDMDAENTTERLAAAIAEFVQ